jgi:hypothetical protein
MWSALRSCFCVYAPLGIADLLSTQKRTIEQGDAIAAVQHFG